MSRDPCMDFALEWTSDVWCLSLGTQEREIHLLCIRGGPITELEQEAMSKIVLEVQADMALYQIHSRIKIELLTYSEFVAIFGDAP
eukprot:m.371637 g.371637  ORF g.371637 m.371637 type:complete len:86 (-) comp16684_c2_seq7:1633-1890(-)